MLLLIKKFGAVYEINKTVNKVACDFAILISS